MNCQCPHLCKIISITIGSKYCPLMDRDPILNKEIVCSHLQPETCYPFSEEERRSWRARYQKEYQKPLLRIWDRLSGSHPNHGHGMMSRAPDMRLDTYDERKSSLAKHLDYKDRTPGPYISFTTDPDEIQRHVIKRHGKDRGPHMLTVVDPRKRVSSGLPILNVTAEMDRYEIQDPYVQRGQYYINEHVCLWQVNDAEFVGHWSWDYLARYENWYQDIIIPAFKRSRECRTVDTHEAGLDVLLPAFNALSGRFVPSIWSSQELIDS